MILRTVFNIKVLTISSFYRVYKISLIKKIYEKYEQIIEESGFISMLEILIKSIRCNASIIELPMILNSDNRNDKSKMKILKTSFEYLYFIFFKKIKGTCHKETT